MLQQCLPLAVLKLAYVEDFGEVPIEVATVLTACGIETFHACSLFFSSFVRLQQCLPLAVLKRWSLTVKAFCFNGVATVLTACGIETIVNTGTWALRN